MQKVSDGVVQNLKKMDKWEDFISCGLFLHIMNFTFLAHTQTKVSTKVFMATFISFTHVLVLPTSVASQ